MRRRPIHARVVAALVGAGGALGLAACSSSGSSAPTTTTPPPPAVIGLVTTIGSGASLGLGQDVVLIDLSAAGTASTARVRVGTFPAAIAVSQKLDRAYVANYASNTLTPINLRTGAVDPPIPAGPGPAGIAITPAGTMAYVANAGSSPIGHTVTPINLVTGKDLTPIEVGDGPEGIAITPDGRYAYVANSGAIVNGQSGAIGNTVTPIDLSTNKALAPITVGNAPEAVAASADGSTVYVANANSESVSPISVASNTAGTPIEVSGSPQALALSGDGSTLWVANARGKSGNVTPIDVSDATAGKAIALSSAPTGIAINGANAYIVCFGSDSVVPLNLTSNALVPGGSVTVDGGPYAIALASVPQAKVPRILTTPPKKAKAHTH